MTIVANYLRGLCLTRSAYGAIRFTASLRSLFSAYPSKSQHSAAKFLNQVLTECAYKIECAYSDNGTEYKGKSDHAFVSLCSVNGISQRFTRPKRPQTNGKAERVIRTLLEMWYEREKFADRSERKRSLIRFVNYYNTVKPHKGINGRTPFEQLIAYFFPDDIL